jgi:hypothetical protein
VCEARSRCSPRLPSGNPSSTITDLLRAGHAEAARQLLTKGAAPGHPGSGQSEDPPSPHTLLSLQNLFPASPPENSATSLLPDSPLSIALRKFSTATANIHLPSFQGVLRSALCKHTASAGAGPDGWSGATMLYLSRNFLEDLTLLHGYANGHHRDHQIFKRCYIWFD